jgi:hypothetical protein
MVIDMDRKGISYRLESYPRVREFATLLARLEAAGRWEGSEFCGYTNPVAGEPATRFCILHRSDGFAISFTPDEWQSLQDLLCRPCRCQNYSQYWGSCRWSMERFEMSVLSYWCYALAERIPF